MNITLKSGKDTTKKLLFKFEDGAEYEVDIHIQFKTETHCVTGRGWEEVLSLQLKHEDCDFWEQIPITPMLLNGGEIVLDGRDYWDQRLRDLALTGAPNGGD